MSLVLTHAFFTRDALDIAQELIGMSLVREINGERRSARITETEAYVGPQDQACHAFRGRTKRTEVLYGPPGHLYVYFVYGMHWLVNIVVREEGYPAAVLLRGVEEISGPARLTRAFQIDGSLHGLPAAPKTGLWVEDTAKKFPPAVIHATPRIGVDYAGGWAKKPYRFIVSPVFFREKKTRAGRS